MATLTADEAAAAVRYLDEARAAIKGVLPALKTAGVFYTGAEVPTLTGHALGYIQIARDSLAKVAAGDAKPKGIIYLTTGRPGNE